MRRARYAALASPGVGMSAARERFTALAARSDAEIDVPTAALIIAQEEYPQLDVAACLAQLTALAALARRHVPAAGSLPGRVARLVAFLRGEAGFTGNVREYYDPRNSYLNEVLERRTGIPITLAIVYCAVGRRLGLPLHGVGFPGHFLVGCDGEPSLIVDPFYGVLLDETDCARRLVQTCGPTARFDRSLLRPATARATLVRLLSNLKRVYLERRDALRALACVERLLLLHADAPLELRDRGLLYRELECFGAALRDLERFLRLAPDGEGAEAVRALLPELRRAAARVQ